MRRSARLLVLVALAGCGDPLKDPELVQETRVLGAKAEVVGEPSRASPAPGESVHLRWLVASPSPGVAVGWAFEICPAAPSTDGRARCDGPAFASPRLDQPSSAEPSFDFVVPSQLGDAQRIAVIGVVCEGTPLGLTACDSGRPLPVQFELLVERGGITNQNPSLAAGALSVDGSPWTGCAQIPAKNHVVLELSPAASDRESLPSGARETLQVSHFSDSGDLTRARSFVEADAADPARVRVGFTAPAKAGTAHVWWVLRDLRGGVDFTEQSLCVVP